MDGQTAPVGVRPEWRDSSMKSVKNIVFVGALALAVGAALASLGAQEPGRATEPRRASVTMLDGRGAQLGVTVRDLEADAAGAKAPALQGQGATALQGVRVDEVTPGSAAEKAGLKEGDVVVEFDGERVRSARQFTRLVQETAAGRTVKMAILRNGQRQVVDATPEARSFSWTMDFDGDRVRRDVERSLRNLPEMRAFRMNPDFRFDGMPEIAGRSRTRLGVSVQSLSPQLADYFGVKDGGALVASVTPGSAAEKAGLKAGDVITSVNGDRVRDADDLTHEISGVSGEAALEVVRDKKVITLKAAL
jgi:S1-C subfamily serine protease